MRTPHPEGNALLRRGQAGGQAQRQPVADSPAIKIAQLDVTRSQLELSRSRREIIPDLSIRAGYADNLEQLGTFSPRSVRSEGFAEVGVNLRLFNRNQGNIQAAKQLRNAPASKFRGSRCSLGSLPPRFGEATPPPAPWRSDTRLGQSPLRGRRTSFISKNIVRALRPIRRS